jgi:hypothetical protein
MDIIAGECPAGLKIDFAKSSTRRRPMGKIPIQWNKLWDAFKNIAIVFSFCTNLVLLIAVIILLDLLFWRLPQARQTVIKPKVTKIVTELNRLEEATINVKVPISDTIPIKFTLPLHTQTRVTVVGSVPLSTNANFVLPGGGGSIRGTVSLALPPGLKLPIELYVEVPVSQTIPVQMEVPVSIRLKDTELGKVLQELKGEVVPLLEPLAK